MKILLVYLCRKIESIMQGEEYKIEIPKMFYSDADDKPFENCKVCGKYLLEQGNSYVIEKAFKNYEGFEFNTTLFEYAICLDCHQQVQQSMSKESMKNLQQYYMQIMADKGNKPIVIDVGNFNLNDWVSTCFFKGDPIEEMNEFQLVAQFNGNEMVLNIPPMVVGERAMDEMADLLSDETIDEIDGFRKQFLGPDPAIEELFSGKKLILL
jgi:hypothetical protein